MTTLIEGNKWASDHTAAVFQYIDDVEFGGKLDITDPYGAGRSYGDQLYLYNLWQAGKGASAYHPNDPRALHMAGRSVDISNWYHFAHLQEVMLRYGFKRHPVEQWHYEDQLTWNVPSAPAYVPSSNAKPIQITGDMMFFRWIRTTTGKLYVLGPKGLVYVQSPQDQRLLERVDSREASPDLMNDAEIDILKKYI